MSGQATATDAAMRAPGNVAITCLMAGGVSLLPLIPGVRRVLGVSPLEAAAAMGLFIAMSIVGSIVFHRVPPGSRAWSIWDRIETATIQVSVLILVVASGRGDSFFWLLSLIHIMIVGNYGTYPRFNLALFGTLPTLVALAFVIRDGDAGAAALSLMVGALGVYIYWLALAVARKLDAADRERQRLAGELAEARVLAERQRIARDIHDGIGADLAALDWRLRGLRDQLGAAALQAEVDELATRLASGTDDLRAVVWALRTPERSWSEIVAYLRQRATELCGERVTVAITDDGDGGVAMRAGEHALDYLRGVLELVRNAVRHAEATRIAIALRSSTHELVAEVSDDGRGMPAEAFGRREGGLANLRHRAERAGGTLAQSRRRAHRITVRVRATARNRGDGHGGRAMMAGCLAAAWY